MCIYIYIYTYEQNINIYEHIWTSMNNLRYIHTHARDQSLFLSGLPTSSRVFEVTSQQQSVVKVLRNLSPPGTSRSNMFGSIMDFRTSIHAFVWMIWALYPLIWSSVNFSNFRHSPFEVVARNAIKASTEISHQICLFIFQCRSE